MVTYCAAKLELLATTHTVTFERWAFTERAMKLDLGLQNTCGKVRFTNLKVNFDLGALTKHALKLDLYAFTKM